MTLHEQVRSQKQTHNTPNHRSLSQRCCCSASGTNWSLLTASNDLKLNSNSMEPMKRTTFTFLLAMMWPSLQALFTVEPEQDSYDGELHKNIRLACRFSPVESVTQLSVFWQRIDPLPVVEVYRLEKGIEKHNFTDKSFQKRARLLKDELEKYRAVLELSQLQMSDSGTYRCIVRMKEDDYKKTTLTVRAPYTAVQKGIKRLDSKKVKLSCESQGFPLAHMVWSDGRLQDLTERSNSSSEKTSEGIYKVISQVTVNESTINNYTCSILLEGKVRQSATFNIPGEIPGKSKWSHGYAAIGVIAVMCVGFVTTSVIVHRRKKGQKNRDSIPTLCKSSEPNLTVTSTDSLLPKTPFFRADAFAFSSEVCEGKVENLREVLKHKYAELSTMAGFTLHHRLLCGESQCEVQSIVPGRGEAIFLEGEEGSGKSSLAKKLAFSWADGPTSDPFNISKTWLVILVDVEEAEGDFFQVVKSKIPSEVGLETADVKEILLGKTDSLLILDSYKEGNREMDQTLIKFLKDRSACRVLITAQPGQHSNLEDTVTKSLQLQR